MPESTSTDTPPAASPRKPRAGRWKRWLGRTFGSCFGLGVLLLGAWFVFGLPLGPFLGLAKGPLDALGLQVAVERALLKPSFGRGLVLTIEGVEVGDLERADRAAVESLEVVWQWGGLFSAHLPPTAVTFRGTTARPSLDTTGNLVWIALRSAPEAEPPPEPSDPLALPLPEFLLPKEGAECRYDLGVVTIELPPEFALAGGERVIARELLGTISRTDGLVLVKSGGALAVSDLSVGTFSSTETIDPVAGKVEGEATVMLETGLLVREVLRLPLPMTAERLESRFTFGASLNALGKIDLVGAAEIQDLRELISGVAARPWAESLRIEWTVGTAGAAVPELVNAEVTTTLTTGFAEARLEHVSTLSAVADLAAGTVSLEHLFDSPDLAPFLALQPPAGPEIEPGDFAISVALDASWINSSVSNLHFAASGGVVGTDPPVDFRETLRVPRWSVRLDGDARWGEYLTAVLRGRAEVALPGRERAAITEFSAESEGEGDVLALELETVGWDLAALSSYLPAATRPLLEGSVGLRTGLRFAQQSRRVEDGSLHLETSALSLRMPAYMARPLRLEPFVLEAEIGRDLESARVAPFTFASNWFFIQSTGLSWLAKQDVVSGEGNLGLATVRAADVLQDLLPELVSGYQLESARELTFGPIKADFSLSGDTLETARGELRVSGEVGNPSGRLPWSLEANVGLTARDWNVRFGFEELRETQWRELMPVELPIPGLNAPVALEVVAQGTSFSAVDEVRWRAEIGAGVIEPREVLSPWLRKAVPIDSFVIAGRLGEAFRRAEVDTLELRMGRGHLAFQRLEMEANDPFYASGQLSAAARLGFVLEDWYLNDWLEYLVPALTASLPMDPAGVGLLGLESFDFSTEVKFVQEPDGSLRWLDLQSGGKEAVFRVGERRFPMQLALRLDPSGKTIGATAELREARLDQLGLNGPLDPFLDMLAFPLSLEIGVEAPATMLGTVEGGPRARLRVAGGAGEILPGDLLGAAIPLTGWELAVGARIDELQLDEFHFLADFGGPRIHLDEVELDGPLGAGPIGGHLRLRLEQFPLAWAWARAPKGITEGAIPPEFTPRELSGALDTLDFEARFLVDPAALGPEALQAFSLVLRATDLGLRPGDLPPVNLKTLTVDGNIEEIHLAMTGAGTDGMRLETLEARVRDPLDEARRNVSVVGRVVGDGVVLGSTLGGCGESLPMPPAIGTLLSAVPANLWVDFDLDAPLLPTLAPADVTAHATVGWEVSVADGAISDLPFHGEVTGGVRVAWETAALTLTGETRLQDFAFADQASGETRVDWTVRSDLQTALLQLGVDLSQTRLFLAPLGWEKPGGEVARLSFGAEINEGLLPGETPQAGRFAIGLEGLLLREVAINGGWNLAFGDDLSWGGLQRVQVDHLAFDGSEMQMELNLPSADALDFHLWGSRLDVRAFYPLLERLAHVLQPADASENPALAQTESEGALEEATPGESSVASTLRVIADLQLDEIVLSDDRSLRGFHTAAVVDGTRVESAAFGFDYGTDDLRFTLKPRGDATPIGWGDWDFHLRDIARLADYLTAPFRDLSDAAREANPTFAQLAGVSGMLLGGEVTSGGAFWQGEGGPVLDASLRVEGLVLVHDIPLLTRISRLVDREVKLGVVFDRFEWETIHFEPGKVHLGGGFLDGPLDLTFEKIDLDLETMALEMKGEIFGVCYEEIGYLNDLGLPYLCESTMLKPMLEEDEFDWGEQ